MSEPPVVCPFCPLHCSDLRIRPGSVVDRACSMAVERYRESLAPDFGQCRVGESLVDVAAMQSHLDQWRSEKAKVELHVRQATIQQAKWIAGLSGSISIHPDLTPTEAAMASAIARCGTITATLGDVRQHADAVILMGDPVASYPRLRDQIGIKPSSDAKENDKPSLEVKQASASLIADWFLQTRRRESSKGADNPNLDPAVQLLGASKYFAVIVGPDAFQPHEAESACELLIEWILWLNQADRKTTRRATLIWIDPLASYRSVLSWTKNQHPSMSTGRDSEEVLRIGVGDGSEDRQPVDLQIGGQDPGIDHARAYAPSSIAGIHESDHIIRGDGTVTLPLRAIPSATEAPLQRKSVMQWLC